MSSLDYMDFDGDFVEEAEPTTTASIESPYAPMAARQENADVVAERARLAEATIASAVAAGETPAVAEAFVATELLATATPATTTVDRARESREPANVPGAEDHPMRSWSAIQLYMTCPKKAFFRYVERIEKADGSALACGKATHRVNDFTIKHRLEKGELPTVTDVCDVARDTATRAKETVDWKNESADPDKVAEKRDDFIDKVIALSAGFHSDVAPTLRAAASEKPFLIACDGMVTKGYIDVVEQYENVKVVRDVKSTTVEPSGWGEPSHTSQLGFYALAEDDGALTEIRGVVDVLLYKKTQRDGRVVRHLPIVLNEAEMVAEAAVAREALHDVFAAVKAGRFPRNPTACSDWGRPCEYLRECLPERASRAEAAIARKQAARAAAAAEKAASPKRGGR